MNPIDARLDAACKRHMKEWSLADFKESHPSLYCAIVEAIDIALHTPLSPAVPAPEPSKVEPLREREAVERYRNARENRDRLSYTTTGCSHETKVAYEEREDARKAMFAALPPAPEDGK